MPPGPPENDAAPPPVAEPARTLDDYLSQALPNLTKRERRRLVARGGVTINGQEVSDVAAPISDTDLIVIPPNNDARGATASPLSAAPSQGDRPPRRAEPRKRPEPKRLPRGISLVYEDSDLLVVDKPPGLVTADPTRTTTDTLFDILKSHVRRAPRGGKRPRPEQSRVWVIHRLDKEASGLLVFARSERAFRALKEDFRAKRVHRLYLAVAEGIVGPPAHAGTQQSFLHEDTRGQVKSIATSEFRGTPGDTAKLAVTHYRVVASTESPGPRNGMSLLQVRLETGRKNQIRIHMADLGHPLAGDRRYGALADPLGRLGLHAAELGFTHPATGEDLRFFSPAPASFYRAAGAQPPRDAGEDAPPIAAPPTRAASTRAKGGAPTDTSWNEVADWYDDLLADRGSDHYEQVILPGVLRLLRPSPGMRILDVACGQGILSRRLADLGARVTGVDSSERLVALARRRDASPANPPDYHVADARALDALGFRDFDAAACIMALGNIEPLEPVLRGISNVLRPGGALVFVIAHPAFRAPGQTSWGWDDRERRQYRRIEGYLSQGQHRIQMHPGSDPDVVTWTFHRPLQAYAKALYDAGMVIQTLEEWPGQRVSTSGPRAPEENRARREIPLFLGLRAIKP